MPTRRVKTANCAPSEGRDQQFRLRTTPTISNACSPSRASKAQILCTDGDGRHVMSVTFRTTNAELGEKFFHLAKFRFVVQALPHLHGVSAAEYVEFQLKYAELFADCPAHIHTVVNRLMQKQAVKLDARRLEFPHCFRTPAEVSVFLAAARKLLPTLPSSVDGNAKIPRTVCPPAVFATDAKQSPKLSPAKVAASVRRSGRSRRRRPADVQGEAKPCAASAPAAKAAAAKAKRADAPCEPAAPVASSALRILNPARIEAAPMSPSLTPRDADDDAEPDVRVVRATRSSRRAPARKRVAPHSSPALETCSKGKRRRRGPFPTWPSQSPRDATSGRPALTVDVPAIVPPFGMESLLSPGDSDFSDGFPDVCTVPGDDEFMLPPLDVAAMELFARDVASLPACTDSSVDIAPVPAGMLPIPASHEFWPACDVYTNADVLEPMPTATLWSLLGARTS